MTVFCIFCQFIGHMHAGRTVGYGGGVERHNYLRMVLNCRGGSADMRLVPVYGTRKP